MKRVGVFVLQAISMLSACGLQAEDMARLTVAMTAEFQSKVAVAVQETRTAHAALIPLIANTALPTQTPFPSNTMPHTAAPTVAYTATPTGIPITFSLPGATAYPPTPTPTTTHAATAAHAATATHAATHTATATAADTTTAAGVNHLDTEKVVLADYMMWYDTWVFGGSMTWDVPSAGAYNSDDPATIQRHVNLAQQACLDGLSAHWYGPQDARTTNNFNQLLAASAGTNLRHVIVFQTNILPGVTEQVIIDAYNFALASWAQGPNYLRLGGRPVLMFTDMPRPGGSDAAALDGWGRIRAAADPDHNSIWFAEGLPTTFNPLFDGLYVYRIDHAQYPNSWLKQPRWANALRAVEAQGDLPLGGLYFADTIAPGFDDTRSVNAPIDLRFRAEHFARDRRNGEYYADTYSIIPKTHGDLLVVKSLNEWIEGTEIEPGTTYGDRYVTLTCQYANTYRSR
jgi:hypothetical protein